MTHKKQMKAGSLALAAAALAGGCTTEAQDVAVSTVDQSLAQTMANDSRYMSTKLFANKAGAAKKSAKIDLADPAQHRFVMNRLAAAGKTAENSPHLFDVLSGAKAKAQARATASKLGAATNAVAPDFCANFIMLGKEKKENGNIKFDAVRPVVSCKGGAAYVYADVTTYNSNRAGTENFLVQSAAGEDYSGGTAFDAVAITPAIPARLGRVNRTDSLVIAIAPDGMTEEMTFSSLETELVPFPGSLNLNHPKQHAVVNNGGNLPTVQMCQLRGTESECDYRIGNVARPGAAFAQFGVPHNAIATVASVNPWVPDPDVNANFQLATFVSNHIYLPLQGVLDVGDSEVGNCQIKSIASAEMRLLKTVTGGVCVTAANFTTSVIPSPGIRKATFKTVADFTNNGGTASPPGVNCALSTIVNESVKPSMQITANVNCGELNPDGSPLIFERTVTLSPEGTTPTPFVVKFLNSCFAEGTTIRRPNGSTASVESLKIGDKVVSDAKGTVLTVTGVSKGIESEPLVEIADDKGHKVQMTSKHPLVKASGEIVFATNIKVGDKVMTDRGVAAVTTIKQIPYSGQVYNLKLGTAEEKAKVGKHGTTMFAGGFLAGDSQMQEELTTPKAPIASLAPAWQRDYQNAAKNNPPMLRVLR